MEVVAAVPHVLTGAGNEVRLGADLIQELVYGFFQILTYKYLYEDRRKEHRRCYALAAAAARAAARRRARIASASGAPMTTASTWRQKAGSPDACRISLRKG